MLSAMATLVAFCTASASSWKKNNASEKVVAEAINRQVKALARCRMRDFLAVIEEELYLFLIDNIGIQSVQLDGNFSGRIPFVVFSARFDELLSEVFILN